MQHPPETTNEMQDASESVSGRAPLQDSHGCATPVEQRLKFITSVNDNPTLYQANQLPHDPTCSQLVPRYARNAVELVVGS